MQPIGALSRLLGRPCVTYEIYIARSFLTLAPDSSPFVFVMTLGLMLVLALMLVLVLPLVNLLVLVLVLVPGLLLVHVMVLIYC
jgi:hypothetical protein